MISVISAADKEIIKQFENLSRNEETTFSWKNDSRAFSYKITQNDVSNVWLQPLAAASPAQITNFSTDEIFSFAWATGSHRLAFEKGSVNNDFFLIKEISRF
jgi:hypothetical protein